MVVPIKIPDVGATVDKATLVRWLVEEGAEIVRGQEIAEIETDKSVIVLESGASGILLRSAPSKATRFSPGHIIAYVGNSMEAVPEVSNIEVGVQGMKPAAPTAQLRRFQNLG